MNSKSLLFVFALIALFNLVTANVVSTPQKRNHNDDEILSDAINLIQKILKNKEEQEQQRIADSLNASLNDTSVNDEVEEIKDEIEIEDPVLENPDQKFIVDAADENNNDEYEEVEVVTVTVELEADEDGIINELDNAKAIKGDLVDSTEVDVVEGEGQVEDVNADVIDSEQPEVNVNNGGLNVVNADVAVENESTVDNEATVDYNVDEKNLLVEKEEVSYYYNVDETDFDEKEDAFNSVITKVDTIDSNPEDNSSGKGGLVGASLAVVSAFGIIAGFGYKYKQRSKRVLLPFHEDLEKGEFFDKNSAEQHIIPVWAATVKKEESEEEKEDEEKLFEVVYNYEPELPDELKLTVGDKIKIKEIYEDGWAYGYNKTTQLFGTFPSTSLGENFNPESVPQYKPEEVAVEMNDNMVEELKKKIVESN